MTLSVEQREADSPYVDSIMHGWTLSDGSSLRPSEIHWHMVFVKHPGGMQSLVVGPLTDAGVTTWGKDAEILWVRFKLGTFMPHLPTKDFTNSEIVLPDAAFNGLWLNSSTWQLPTYENVDTFINRLIREEILAYDPLVNAALQDQVESIPERTLRHRFLRSTGLTQSHIRQYGRAQQAAALLQQGVPILDTVYEVGYFDQPHLTRSLKRFIGKTPSQQILRVSEPG